MTVSVVIPTRNRVASVTRLLTSLSRQTASLHEIILVDAGDPDALVTTSDVPRGMKVTLLRSEPSVCRQRNAGVRIATGDVLFLCDDDMEPEPAYVETLMALLARSDAPRLVSGMIVEADQNGITAHMPRMPFRRILWNWIFGLSVWTDINQVSPPFLLRPLWLVLRGYYRVKGNARTGAGWPLVTQVEGATFTTEIFGLGASLTYRTLLLEHPFDESLDERGIGDNYELLDRIGPSHPVVVETSVCALHQRSAWSELADPETYARRILVLDAVRQRRGRSSRVRLLLLWSLVGNTLGFLMRGRREHTRTTLHLIRLILSGRNPYDATLGTAGRAPSTQVILPSPLRPQ